MNEQRTKVFLDRYAKKGPDGKPVEKDPTEMWDRVAESIGDTAQEVADFTSLLWDFKFVPGGRILAGAGVDAQVTYYNCYVIPVETKARRLERQDGVIPLAYEDTGCDSREAIFDTIGLMVDIMSRGGGVGINWSVLRPKGAYLKRVNGTTSGPVSWMDVASRAVGVVEQGGSRRGAAMFMLDDWHPDIMEFINAKRDFSLITNANVSVAVSDEFMDAVRLDGDWTLRYPDTSDPWYDQLWNGDLAAWEAAGRGIVAYDTVRARDLWHALAEAAWRSGEPGVVFLDRYNKVSTGKGIERIISVNPCGEQGLGAYSVCNLGAMNLDAYIKEKDGRFFDWGAFGADVETAVRFLDNVIDKTYYFIPENEKAQKEMRRIGLGVMGLADALIALGLRYGSNEAVAFTERVFKTMKMHAVTASCVLAQQKGKAPAWDLDETILRPYFDNLAGPIRESVARYGLRNMFLLTQAPTGTTSILAGVNSGIEPYFAFEYTRKDRTGTHTVKASAVEKYAKEGDISGGPFVTSNDVSVEEHLTMQAAAQAYIDSSVSKTINGPNWHTVEDVERAYTLAYDKGLKGLAYFRDGSGRDQVLYKNEPRSESLEALAELREMLDEAYSLIEYAKDYTRPAVLTGETIKTGTRAGTAYITVNRDPDIDRAVEVFFNVGKAGSDVASMAEALGRLASLALRHGASIGGVANQLEGVGGPAQFNKPIPHAIGEVLSSINGRKVVQRNDLVSPLLATGPEPKPLVFDLCPECGTTSLVREEGCAKCHACGYSQC